MTDTIKLYTYCLISMASGMVQLLEHVALWFELFAGIMGAISFILAIMKYRKTRIIDHQRLENEKLENEIKQQILFRQIEKNKDYQQNP